MGNTMLNQSELIIRTLNLNSASIDLAQLWKIKFDTIRQVNCRDYSLEQIKAWAPSEQAPTDWPERITLMDPFIAELSGDIVGFADLQQDGYVDHFFCHHEYQGQGIGRSLMLTLLKEAEVNGLAKIYSHVSITARPFFEHFGFNVVKPQQVVVRGTTLTNYVMERILER